MREALRGALLSVLFFALMIGGAPTMAAAGPPTAQEVAECEQSGGEWKRGLYGSPGSCVNNERDCK